MPLIEGKQFRKIIRRYHCDDEGQRQIKEFIISTMIPDEDIILLNKIINKLSNLKLIIYGQIEN
jgi:hypothetical protein